MPCSGCGYVPSIYFLQLWLEQSRDAGFDDLDPRDYVRAGEETWIGPADMQGLMSFFGIRSEIVEFRVDELEAGQSKIMRDFLQCYFQTPWERFQLTLDGT